MPQIDVKNSSGLLLAILTPAADGLKDAEISRQLNGDHTLAFILPATSNKLQYITENNYIYCNSMEFAVADPDCVQLVRQDGKLWAKVQARESWCLLDRQHITICNDTNVEGYGPLEVIITTTGTTAGGYAAGSAGSALSHILAGSGWTVGTVDVTGIYEVRTSQESVLVNVNKCQELWGGWLVFNSAAHTISLRKDSIWQPYNGYEIRLGKNLEGVTKTHDYDIVTKLWAFGQNDAHFQDGNTVHSGTAQSGGAATITLQNTAVAINDAYTDGTITLTGGTGSGQERRIIEYVGSTRIATVDTNWVTPPNATTTYSIKAKFLLDFTNLNAVRSYIWRSQDIVDPAELLVKADEVHDELAAARVHYKVDHVDLQTLTTHDLETFTVGDMVDIIDDDLSLAVEVRVIKYTYDVFQPWKCSVELGDVSYDLKNILADIRKSARVTYQQGRSSSSTFVIAHQISSKLTRRADFIVPNGDTSIQTWIAKAIALLPAAGGKIMLLEGEYIRDGNIILPSNVTLEGQGAGTVIKTKDNYDTTGYAITNSDPGGGNVNIAIFNLKLDGNKTNQSAGNQDSIYFNNVSNSHISGVQVTDFRYRGITLMASIKNSIENCIVSGNVINGMNLGTGSTDNTIQGSIVDSNSNYGIFISANNNTVTGNVIKGNNAGIGIQSNNNTIAGNQCVSSGSNGIWLYAANNNTVIGNTVRENGYHGIAVEVYSDNNTVTNNISTNNSQNSNNTYDNIHLNNEADYNNLQGNTCRRGALANKPRYGIRINSADCDGNLVTNNDLYDSGSTASFSDGGTSTITTAGNRL